MLTLIPSIAILAGLPDFKDFVIMNKNINSHFALW